MKKRVVMLILAMMVCTACGPKLEVEPIAKEDAGSEMILEEMSSEDVIEEESETAEEENLVITSEEISEESDSAKTELVEDAATKKFNVVFDHRYEDMCEKGTIIVSDENGEIWRYDAQVDEIGQIDGIELLGETETQVFLLDKGIVMAFDLATGAVAWVNDDYRGSTGASVITEDGLLFLCGYFGPFYQVIGAEGQTLYRCADPEEEDLYWPYDMKVVGDSIRIYCESNEDAIILVNRKDFTYSVE